MWVVVNLVVVGLVVGLGVICVGCSRLVYVIVTLAWFMSL